MCTLNVIETMQDDLPGDGSVILLMDGERTYQGLDFEDLSLNQLLGLRKAVNRVEDELIRRINPEGE